MRLPPTRIRLPHSELAEYNRIASANPPIDNPEAAFILKALIGKDGTIQELTLLAGDPQLAQPVMDAVRRWTYRPVALNGNPVEVVTSIVVPAFGPG
jgi:hypothetical protein